MTDDALVIFTPSGKRGRFALGTPVLTAARQLGVDLDSVCGGRGICSKCQITPGYGEFPKHGVTVAFRCAVRLERGRGALQVDPRTARWPPPRLPGEGHGRRGDRRAARKPGAQAGHPQVGHDARHRDGPGDAASLRRGGRARHARTDGRFRAAGAGAARPVAGGGCGGRSGDPAPPATRAAQGRVEGDSRPASGPPRRPPAYPGPLAGLP